MQTPTSVELTRDCEVVQIPHGTPTLLPKGTAVDITQTLGGTYTVYAGGGLFRVAGKDADALGLAPTAEATGGGALTEDRIWQTLKTCYDPEIPVNIVDLGLVYDMEMTKLAEGSHRVGVKMTLTAPGCGMGPAIAGDAEQKLLSLDGVDEARVEIVWDPAWHQSMITPEGRRLLGIE
jgi:probable FeS assembly SUF system protein SufT